jgi:ABC-type nickel/cobalt efflux system permease component RcnA
LFWLGVLGFGIAHAFEPDHMAAVSTFVATRPKPREAAMFGCKWAIGHGLSLLALGSALYLLKLAANQPALFASGVLDRIVGFVLIGLGGWMALQLVTRFTPPKTLRAWRNAFRLSGKRERTVEAQIMEQQASARTNRVAEDGELPLFGAPGATVTRAPLPGKTTKVSTGNKYGSLWMGMLHGAAGTSAFIGQAAITLAKTYPLTLMYTVLFSIGVLLAMSFYAMLLGGVLTWGEHRSAKLLRGARWATSLATCAIGVCLVRGIELPGLLEHFVH